MRRLHPLLLFFTLHIGLAAPPRAEAAPPAFRRVDQAGLPGLFSIISADFNGDSVTDLALGPHSGLDVTVLLGNGLGGFLPKRTFYVDTYANYLAVGDFNGDAVPDIG